MPALISDFLNLWKSEVEGEEPALLADGLRADIVALCADLARVQGDVLLLRGELEPLKRVEHSPQPVIFHGEPSDAEPEPQLKEDTIDEP